MPLVFLVRHGRTQANASGILAGWTPGVHLDDKGRSQAEAAAGRLSALRLAAIVSSPLERTVQTAEAINQAQRRPPGIELDERLGECRYGEWTNRPLSELAKTPLWRTVQERPSAVTLCARGTMYATCFTLGTDPRVAASRAMRMRSGSRR